MVQIFGFDDVKINKLASLEAMIVRNYVLITHMGEAYSYYCGKNV